MAEYIDREAMLEQIARREPKMVGDKMISIDALRAFIMNRPVADVEEVKHGHWIIDKRTGKLRCSVCGDDVFCGDLSTYCAACGAKMDEEDEDDT